MGNFGPFLALNGSDLAPGAAFEFYASTDAAFSSPLECTDPTTTNIVTPTAGADGYVREFVVEGYDGVWGWVKSGSLPAQKVFSFESADEARTAAIAAQAAAEAAALAAAEVAASASGIVGAPTSWPSVFPPSAHTHPGTDITSQIPIARIATGTPTGTKFVRDDGTLAEPPGTGGGGGSGISGAPATWPTSFPPSAHSHPASQISDSSPAGRTVLTSSDPVAQRNAIGAGRSDVMVAGAYTGAAAPAAHGHSKADVGLGSVDNTSDVNKPVSVPQAAALASKADVAALSSLASSTLRFVDSVTGSEPRPSGAGRVVWIGGSTQPVNMADGDVWWGEAA